MSHDDLIMWCVHFTAWRGGSPLLLLKLTSLLTERQRCSWFGKRQRCSWFDRVPEVNLTNSWHLIIFGAQMFPTVLKKGTAICWFSTPLVEKDNHLLVFYLSLLFFRRQPFAGFQPSLFFFFFNFLEGSHLLVFNLFFFFFNPSLWQRSYPLYQNTNH